MDIIVLTCSPIMNLFPNYECFINYLMLSSVTISIINHLYSLISEFSYLIQINLFK